MNNLLKGEILIPLPTYFTLGKHPLPQQIIEKLEKSDDEVCPNLYFLNKRSTTKTSEGLRIVNLGGILDPASTAGISKDRFLPFHTEGDAHALRGANTADILITSHWPPSVRTGSQINISDETKTPPAEQCVADLCSALKPRYHFTTSNEIFYEREPFFHLSDQGQPDTASITRFISLAAFNNPLKQKWLYAFSIDPSAAPPITLPVGTTASPLDISKKRNRLPDQEQSYSRFSKQQGSHHHHPNKRSRNHAPPTPQECFFCLSNPNLATHLITSIANDSYLTTAKGPLTTPSTFPSLKCPAHILIIPLAHTATLADIPEADSRASSLAEMHKYRRTLQRYLMQNARDESLGAVTWELSRAAGVHVHWQFLPVAANLVERGLVEAAFKVEAENEKYPAFQPTPSPGLDRNVPDEGDHFRVWIWRPDAAKNTARSPSASDAAPTDDDPPGSEFCLSLPIPTGSRFDAQFGRRVMAKLLGLEKRMDWRDCAQDSEQEKKDAEAFKDGFKGLDFSLDA